MVQPEEGGAKNKSWYKQMFKNMHATSDTVFSPPPATGKSQNRPTIGGVKHNMLLFMNLNCDGVSVLFY